MTPAAQLLDCIGRGKLTEQQMMPMIAKIKRQGLLQEDPPPMAGRGIVICGGGRYTKHAWAVAARCRELGWREGIQVWHLGADEISPAHRPLFGEIDVELVDAEAVRTTFPIRILGGWESKVYAVMNCPWRHVLFLDADAHPAVNPAEFFNHRDIQKTGSIFFSDTFRNHQSNWAYVFCGLVPLEKEWESGVFLVDKHRAWMGLRWAAWLNEHSEVWYRLVHGDKGTLELGIRMSGVPHLFSVDSRWEGYGIGQYWGGKLWVKHWMSAKRGEVPFPEEIQVLFDEWDRLSAPVGALSGV